jgi:hypothetical protein
MTPFGPVPFLQFETRGVGGVGQHLFLPTVKRPDGSQLYVGFHLIGTSGNLDLSEIDLSRLFCHALIQGMPDEGLREAVESLSGMYEYYNTPVEPPKPPAVPERIPVRITGSYVRPVHPVPEDY